MNYAAMHAMWQHQQQFVTQNPQYMIQQQLQQQQQQQQQQHQGIMYPQQFNHMTFLMQQHQYRQQQLHQQQQQQHFNQQRRYQSGVSGSGFVLRGGGGGRGRGGGQGHWFSQSSQVSQFPFQNGQAPFSNGSPSRQALRFSRRHGKDMSVDDGLVADSEVLESGHVPPRTEPQEEPKDGDVMIYNRNVYLMTVGDQGSGFYLQGQASEEFASHEGLLRIDNAQREALLKFARTNGEVC